MMHADRMAGQRVPARTTLRRNSRNPGFRIELLDRGNQRILTSSADRSLPVGLETPPETRQIGPWLVYLDLLAEVDIDTQADDRSHKGLRPNRCISIRQPRSLHPRNHQVIGPFQADGPDPEFSQDPGGGGDPPRGRPNAASPGSVQTGAVRRIGIARLATR